MIDGVIVRELEAHPDERGSFTETFRQDWLPAGARPMLQSNLSRSSAGVLRGMHFHRQQSDWWVVLEGSAFIALYDLRSPGSPEPRSTFSVEAPGTFLGIFIPPGVAHGFLAITAVTLQYLVDAAFDGSDEFGFAWDDPEVGIDWPITGPTLSPRDRSNPSLAEAVGLHPHMG